jgi:hypothetical protein
MANCPSGAIQQTIPTGNVWHSTASGSYTHLAHSPPDLVPTHTVSIGPATVTL